MVNSFCNFLSICPYVKKRNYFAFTEKVRPEVSYKTDVRKHFRSSRPVRLRPATLLKMRLWHRCFPVNFVKFLRIPYFTEHPRWLLLTFRKIHRRFTIQNWKFTIQIANSQIHNVNSQFKIRCWSLLLIKMFSCKFYKIFKTPNLQNICRKQSSRGVLLKKYS